MEKIYLVEVEVGDFEDRRITLFEAYEDESDAKNRVSELQSFRDKLLKDNLTQHEQLVLVAQLGDDSESQISPYRLESYKDATITVVEQDVIKSSKR